MSMNEELQSANEELESSREELQSMNEELNTVNSQLQHKVDELEKSQNDVENLLTSSDIATLFLDRDMRIQLVSPPAARLLNLRDGDIGRTISDFSAKAAKENLVIEANQVLDSLIPVERVVWPDEAAAQGRCYLRRTAPYRSADTGVHGVVVTYIDITERYQVEERLEARVRERTCALHEREHRLQGIMNAVTDAIIIIGPDGQIQEINPATTRLFGYTGNDLSGRNINLLIPSPYQEERKLDVFARYLGTKHKSRYGKVQAFTGRRKNDSSFPLELVIVQIDDLDLFAAVVHDLSEKYRLEREIISISTREQERISRDIHDVIGQQLTGINILAASLRNDLKASGYKEHSKLDDMIRYLTSLIGDTRDLSQALAPVAIRQSGLVGALQTLAEQTTKATAVICHLQHDYTLLEYQDENAATQIYRIAQEAVNNAVKHANATRIAVSLKLKNGILELTISDDGRGFELDEAEHSTGIGLRIMQYRADVLGGQLVIRTAPGKSTFVRFRMPCDSVPA
jgi:two-component system CheB/CheR fusion protein